MAKKFQRDAVWINGFLRDRFATYYVTGKLANGKRYHQTFNDLLQALSVEHVTGTVWELSNSAIRTSKRKAPAKSKVKKIVP